MEIVNLRNFRSKLSHYISRASAGDNIIVNSKGREVVMLSLEDYQELTGDETEYLLSSMANKKHLLKGKKEIDQNQTNEIDVNELFD